MVVNCLFSIKFIVLPIGYKSLFSEVFLYGNYSS